MDGTQDQLFSAPELAKALGITPRALRFYETKGLVAPRRVGVRRVYDHRDRARLQLILRGKRLGFSLAEIAEYLELYHADPTQLEQLKRLETMVDQRIETLTQQQAALETTLDELSEIRLQVLNALKERGAAPAMSKSARPSRPRIRAKSANGGGQSTAASGGDN